VVVGALVGDMGRNTQDAARCRMMGWLEHKHKGEVDSYLKKSVLCVGRFRCGGKNRREVQNFMVCSTCS
jgi:hypothetical protein